MRKIRVLAALALVASLTANLFLGACAGEKSDRLKVVTSTSHLEQLVQRIGGDLVDVINIVPPASHPGDFDASPGDIQKLADARLFLWHNWPGEIYVPGLIESADNPDLNVVAIDISGSWMTPEVELQAVDMVRDTLIQVDSANSAAYQAGADKYKESVKAADARVKSLLEQTDLSKVKVICAGWQAGFVKWVGLSTVATYGLPTAPTIADIEKLVEQGREAGVTLVIDNLHNDANQGKPIATELGCKRVVLYNFPGVDEKTKTWEDTFETNINLILDAVR
jgi:zinc transport system substrate-binding protein